MALLIFKMPSVKHLATVMVVVMFVLINTIHATTYVKNNTATNLNVVGSWSGGPPGSGDIAQWTSVSDGTGSTASLGGNVSWGGIQITNATNWITIYAGNTLTLGTSGIDMSGSAQSFSINCLVALNADQTWNIISGQIIAMNAAISGSHALTKSGSGSLFLNDNNTYTGQTTVSGGILAFAPDGGVKGGVYSYGTASGTIVINNGGTVRLDTNDFMGAHTSVPVATVTINAGGIMASNATFSTLNNLTLSGGTLQSNGGTPAWGSFGLKGTVTVNGTVTSNISTGTGSDNNVFVGTNTAGGTTTFNVGNTSLSGDDLDVSSVLTNNRNSGGTAIAGGLIKTGAGTMMLSGANTFTGGVTISGGILKAGSTTALGDVGNTITINSTGALDVNDINLQDYTSAITINGQMDATDGAIFNSSGTQQINAIRAIALGSNASIGSNGGRFDIGRGYSGNTYITGNSHTLTKVGSNQVCIITQSTGLTSVVVSGGMLSGECTNVFGGVPITVNSGGQISQWNTITLSDSIYLNGGTLLGQFEYGNAFSSAWSGPIALAASTIDTLMADVSSVINPVTLSGKISGSGSLVMAGTGLFILSNTNNSFSGGLTITSGTIQLGASGVIPDGTNKGDIAVNGTLDLNGHSEGINGLSGAGTITSGVSGAVTLTVGNNNDTSTFSGIIQNGSGTMAFTKAGSGVITLSGANTYTGATTVGAGTLLITNSTGSGTGTGSVGVSSGATLGGTGKIGTKASTVTVNNGATLAPGAGSTGRITINNNLTFVSGATLNLNINSNTPMTGYDQVFDTGTVTLGNATLTLTLGYAPTNGQTFTIMDNGSAGAVVGTFNGIAQGGSVTATYNSVVYSFTVSYTSGTGNDVVLTCASTGANKIWTNGGGGNNWNTPTNWNPSGVPTSGDTVSFQSSYTANCNLNVNDTVRAISFTSGYTGTFNFSSYKLSIGGTFGDFRSGGTITAGTGTLEFSGTTGKAQVFSPKSTGVFPAITNTGNDTLRLSANPLNAASFSQSAGPLDFNGLNITTTGDFTITNGGSTSFVNFGGRKITVGGNASLSGAQANALYISPATPCSLAVTGTLTAYGATMSNCKASGTAAGTATNSTDAGGNYRWTFVNTAEDYTQWHYSKKVYINTKEGGANISTDQSNFPLLVRLTSANFNFTQAQSSGQDVRFSKSDGTHFNYQIERWDNTNLVAEVWVNVDVIKGYNDAQYIWMYWGKSNAADSSRGTAVFDTANGFAGVWHLGESSGNAIDATINGIKDTAKGTVKYQQTGGVGYSDSLTGSSSYLVAGNAYNTLLNMSARDKVTVSAWVRRDGAASGNSGNVEGIAGKYKWTSNLREYCLGNNATTGFAFWVSSNGTAETPVSSATVPTLGTWYYVTGVMDATNMTIFVNGVQKAQTGYTTISTTNTSPFRIGLMDDDGSNNKQYFNGEIDEVIVADTNRSADWIKLCYETQKANQTTVTVQENYSEWTYSKNLYFNTKPSGANVTNNVVKFPILVRLDSTNFDFTTAQDSGQDLRFAKSDGTHLYYQIEKWDNIGQQASVWVRADTIYGNDSLRYATMYWGNVNVFSMSNAKAVFDTGNGFVGVWHLNNSDFTDATSNHNDATNYGTTDTVGVIGTSRKFVYTNPDSIRVLGLLGSPATVTVSAWVKVEAIDATSGSIVSIGDNVVLEHKTYQQMAYHYASSWRTSASTTNLIGAGWSHVAFVCNPGSSSQLLYVNGQQAATAANPDAIVYNQGLNTLFGRHGNGGTTSDFGGIMDEIRIEKTPRSVDWIKLCFENQKPVQALVVYSNEDYSQWAYSRKVNLNTTPSGANVANAIVNFPTLIRLTSTNFSFAQALDDGSDVRFASSLGKRLAYQIERWDRPNQLAEIWVLADTVKGNNGTQYFTMYWGKTGVGTRSKSADVFDTTNGFVGVWHLGEGSGNAFDATANGINDTAKGTVKYHQTGGVAYSDSLTGASSYFAANNAYNTLLNMSARNKVTVSAWVRRDGAASGNSGNVEGIAGKYKWAASANAREYCILNNATTGFAFSVSSNGTAETSVNSAIVPTLGTWYYVTGVMDATNMTIFVNGVQKAQIGSTTISSTTTSPFRIGLMDDDGSYNKQYFNGEIDEVIVADTNRSADWVKLCYENQKANQTLVDLDDYNQWAFSKKIYINTTGTNMNSYVTKFPLLVRLDTTMINFSTAQASGQDIRFSKADGTHFYYEKEQWDTTNQKASLWVLVDTIFQNNNTQYLKMYWGKSDANDNSNSDAVFDTANGFVGVWHFTPESGTDTLRDATINGFTLTNVNSTPITTPPIALGRTLNGSNQRLYVNDAPALKQTGNLTLSAWINHAALPASSAAMGLVSKNVAEYRFADSTFSGNNYLSMHVGGTRYTSSAATTFGITTWYFAAAALDAAHDTLLFYKNGVKLGNTVTSATGVPASGTNTLNIGDDQSSNWFNGSMDEVRLEKVFRNPDWINLCYFTQNPTQTTTQTDTSSELYSPLTVATYPVSGVALDSCTIATHNWTVKFSAVSRGGGISWLSPDSMRAATNQLDTNLFTILTDNDSSSKGTATLQLLDKSNVFVRLLQQRTIGTTHPLQYQIYYTILGNGKAYVRVYTYGASAVTPSNGLEFRIATSSGSANYSPSATASSCNYLLHSDATPNRLDPCLALFENWSQATSITTGTNYVGIRSSSWKIPANRSQAWEFMLDLAHRNWNDSTGVGSYISEYNHPDSLTFYAGTPYLEKTWEDHLSSHLKFEEGTGDTAFDNSGSNNFGIRTAASTWNWTSGKWGGGLGLRTGDTVKILDNTAFDGGSSGFTILSWINPSNTLTGVSGIFRKSTGTAGYALTGGSNGTIQLNLGGTTFSGRTNVGYGSWRHVGAVYEKIGGAPDTVRLFVDGKPDTVITGSNYSFASSGVNALAGNGFSGTLDDVRFYNEAISDEQLKTIYQLGWSSSQGMYMVRADNSSQVNFTIDGGAYHRNFPVFQVSNWFNTAALSGSNPLVYMNGSQLTYNKDYYVMADANNKKATVGFNCAINSDGTRIYIGSDAAQAGTTGAMPRMYWGITTLKAIDYVWLRNFSGDVFGSSTAGQFFIDWKMGITGSKGGDIWYMMSSSTTPNTVIDTTGSHSTSLGIIPGTDAANAATWGALGLSINGTYVKSSQSTSAFTYTIPESSAVRIIIRLGQRNLTDSARLFTQWTIYPTGQIFRWDSIPWVKSTNISQVVHSFGMDNVTSPTITMNKKYLRGHVSNASLQDFCIAFLSFKNSGGPVAAPWTADTMNNASDGFKTQIEFKNATTNPNTVWNAVPVQCNFYQDIQKPVMDSAYRDSVCKGVQYSTGASASRLTTNGNGSTVLNSPGDLNTDGFNEKEGAYIYQADNANTAHFTLTAHADTCRFNPAFRITNYTATSVPQYVYVAGQTLVQGYGYNAYLKQATHELIMQIKKTICANTDIYISSDKTLAVTMADFNANGGDRTVRLRWVTESEENNLGFFMYRRIKPRFVDSLLMSPASMVVADTSSDSSDEKSPGLLFKTKVIGFADTAWKPVNDRIIYGAMAGVSYGKRAYSLLDRGVFNSVQYEYKLVAVDYNNGRDAYDKMAEAMPHRILPMAFELYGNFPNPFRTLTYLKFDVPVKTRAMLNVYSIQGRLIRRIVKPDNVMKPGFYRVAWDCKDDNGRLMASGPYIYRFSAPGFAKAKIMIVMK
jgi:autotransporter-associated beta strand protein